MIKVTPKSQPNRCAYCHDSEPTDTCERCGTAYHADCGATECPTLGCVAPISYTSPPYHLPRSEWTEADHELDCAVTTRVAARRAEIAADEWQQAQDRMNEWSQDRMYNKITAIVSAICVLVVIVAALIVQSQATGFG